MIMEKFGGTRYNSRWDGSTWFILGLVAVCCVTPCFMDDGIWPTIICLVMLAFVMVTFLSIYYRIDGDKLVVYTFFIRITVRDSVLTNIVLLMYFCGQKELWVTTGVCPQYIRTYGNAINITASMKG